MKRLAGVVLAVVAACTPPAADEEWLAHVGSDTITASDYRQRLRQINKDLGEIPVLGAPALKALKTRVLNEMIDERLLLQAAARRGLDVTPEQLAAEAAGLRRDMSERDWRRFLLENYVDERAWEAAVERKLRMDAVIDAEIEAAGPISDAEIRHVYETTIERFRRPREVLLSQIVVDDEAAARALRTELKGGADFAALAAEHSLGPEADGGGDLGYLRANDLPASFAAAFSLRPGQLSDVVATEYGYHVFTIRDIREAHVQPLEAVAGQIRGELQNARRDAVRHQLVTKLRQETEIEVNAEAWHAQLETQ